VDSTLEIDKAAVMWPQKRFGLLTLIVSAGFALALIARWTRPERDSHDQPADLPAPGVSTDAGAPAAGYSTTFVVPRSETSDWSQWDDPQRDGWQTEVFSQEASDQLRRLARLIVRPEPPRKSELAELAIEPIECGELLPSGTIVYEAGPVRVRRDMESSSTLTLPSPSSEQGEGTNAAGNHHSLDGLARGLEDLRRLAGASRDPRCEFKLFHVERVADNVTTRQFFSLSGVQGECPFEVHALWITRWRHGNQTAPRLAEIRVEQFEHSTVAADAQTFFTDYTATVLGRNASYREQLLHGFNEWLQSGQDDRFNFLLGNPGISVGDVNGDGLDDLYVCQEEGLPNRLYVQRTDGTAEDASAASGVDWIDNSKCSLLVDLDNDGDQDLAIAINGGVAVAENDGRGRFQLRTVIDTSDDVMSLTAVDFDADGRLDLYAGVYHEGGIPHRARETAIAAAAPGIVYHDSNSGGANSLLRNQITSGQDWTFVDVSAEIGLDANNRRFTLAAAWEDYDNDGDQDLYVANDFGRNNLYRHDRTSDGRHHFVDVAAETGTEDSASGMSVSWGDYNRDGWADLYIGNMFSAAGNRITWQDRFKSDASPEIKSRLRRFARGNSLFRNAGPQAPFVESSEAAGVEMGQWSWSSNFVDLNNDGWDDLVVANGYITTDDTGDL
jgi:hypothetical protein